MTKKRILTKEEINIIKELKREYYSWSYIAKQLNIKSETLTKYIKENDIKVFNKVNCSKLSGKRKDVIKKFKECGTLKETAEYFKVGEGTIKKVVKYEIPEIELKKGFKKGHIINQTHGLTKHPLRQLWAGINTRCYNIKCKDYKNYGAKGITNFWKQDLEGFIKYIENNLGGRPKEFSLDRLNPLGNYEPGNIRWADRITQAYNKSDCFERDINTVNTQIILKDIYLTIKLYSIKELQMNKEIASLKNGGVYIIKCASNNNYYIGSTRRNFRARWKEIRKHCKNNKSKISKYLRKFWVECDGENNFKFGVLEYAATNIKEREQYWINRLEPSLNIVKIVY